ncbi:MAG TPA: OmpW family outer membrane protein [Burkholderiales bacterium]|nr:OmpW family outer membrane protein [Burkholderiales bacterium]
MRPAHVTGGLGLCIALGLAGVMGDAQAADKENSIQIGYAYIDFNTKSADLKGPPGTTPPGVQADLKNASTLALVYERHIYGPWSLVVQGGAPPTIKLMGAGVAAPLGQVGKVRAWFPGVLGQYTFDGPWGSRPYLAAGVNYTTYTDEQVGDNFTAAFGGTSSTAEMKSSWGYIAKVGVSVPLNKDWFVDASYSRYQIRTTATVTTATPGFGNIIRTIDVKADPGIFGLTVGYRF